VSHIYRIATHYGDQTVPRTDVRGANSPSQDIIEGYRDSATLVLREFMERMQPRSWSAPGAGAPHLADLDLPNKADPEWTVLMWDARQARPPLISRIVCECGARPRWVDGLSAIPPVEFSRRCNLAVVALGACPSPGALCLEGIRRLKQKGFRIICYEEGVQSWPLSLRCQVLLAGASWLLDSAKAGFP
jgi:hypothetical protein